MSNRKTEPGITAVFFKRIKVEKPGNLFACAMIKFKKPAHLKENNISGKHFLKISILLPYHNVRSGPFIPVKKVSKKIAAQGASPLHPHKKDIPRFLLLGKLSGFTHYPKLK